MRRSRPSIRAVPFWRGCERSGGALDDLVQLAAVEPDAAAVRAVIDFDALAFGHGQPCSADRARQTRRRMLSHGHTLLSLRACACSRSLTRSRTFLSLSSRKLSGKRRLSSLRISSSSFPCNLVNLYRKGFNASLQLKWINRISCEEKRSSMTCTELTRCGPTSRARCCNRQRGPARSSNMEGPPDLSRYSPAFC